METEPTAPSLRHDLSAVIRQGFMLLLMLIVSDVLGYLPGADFPLGGRIPIAVLLRFAISLGMAAALLLVYRPAARLLRHGVAKVFLRGPSNGPLEASATKAANSAMLLLYVCFLYGIFMRGFEPLVVIFTAAGWPFTVIRLCSIVLAVIAIVGLFIGASPLFGRAGDALAGQVVPAATPGTAPLKCPGCGVLDDGGSKYCRFCGRPLAEVSAAAASAPPITCTRCGGAVSPPARFCPACGKPV